MLGTLGEKTAEDVLLFDTTLSVCSLSRSHGQVDRSSGIEVCDDCSAKSHSMIVALETIFKGQVTLRGDGEPCELS